MRRVLTAAVLVLCVGSLCAGCFSSRRSPSGFRLPPGDATAGQKAFVDLQCTTCHTMAGVESLPAPTVPAPIALGGNKPLPPTDGDLTTDIIMPSSHFAEGYPAAQTQEGAKSKMPDYTTSMTVRQLADLVAFLQQHYGVGI
jgi:mono/diheme cytochrome c family protein